MRSPQRGHHLAHVGVLGEDRAIEGRANDGVLQRDLRALDQRLRDRDAALHLEVARFRGIHTRRGGKSTVSKHARTRELPLHIVKIGLAELQVGAGLRELRAHIGVLKPGRSPDPRAPGPPRPRPEYTRRPVPFEAIAASARHHVAARNQQSARVPRPHHRGGRQSHLNCAAERAPPHKQRGYEYRGTRRDPPTPTLASRMAPSRRCG